MANTPTTETPIICVLMAIALVAVGLDMMLAAKGNLWSGYRIALAIGLWLSIVGTILLIYVME